MPRETWRQKLGNTLRIGGAASVGFMPAVPLLSPQEFDEQAQAAGHHLILPQLPSPQLSFQLQDRQIAASAEQEAVSQPLTFGRVAFVDNRGGLSVYDFQTQKIRELPITAELASGKLIDYTLSSSPLGDKLAIWWSSPDSNKSVLFDLNDGNITILSQEQTPYSTHSQFDWSVNGEYLSIQGFDQGSNWTKLFNVTTGQVILELPSYGYVRFTQNQFWAYTTNTDLILVDLANGQLQTHLLAIPQTGEVKLDVAPDRKTIAASTCVVRFPDHQFTACLVGELWLYDGNFNKPIRSLGQVDPNQPMRFSPDGKKLFFFLRSWNENPPYDYKFAPVIFDLVSNRINAVGLDRVQLGIPKGGWSRIAEDDVIFRQNGDLIIVGSDLNRFMINFVNTRDGSVITKTIRGNIFWYHLTEDSIFFNREGENGYLRLPLDATGRLTEQLIGHVPFMGDRWGWFWGPSFATVPDNSLIASQGAGFFVHEGKRYWLGGDDTAQILNAGKPQAVGRWVKDSIAEGQALQFVSGDVVTGPDWAPWYLRNGKRYKIDNWNEFAKNTRFNRSVHKELPQWVLDRIPVGQDPRVDQARRYGGVIDWDGALKEHQPDGGRMIIFVGGYSGSSEGQKEAFEKIKSKLKEKGWNDRQFLEATYDLEILAKDRVRRVAYDSDDTKDHPLVSAAKMRIQLELYKQMFPKTKFILIGHSLGGFLAFNAALGHSEAIESVVTLDSPLLGIDNLITDAAYGTSVRRFIGDDCGEFLTQLYNDSSTKNKVEALAKQLKSKGVRLYTFASVDDWFVKSDVANLNESNFEFDNEPIRLLWRLGYTPAESWQDLVFGHGQILIDPEFLNELIKVLPSS